MHRKVMYIYSYSVKEIVTVLILRRTKTGCHVFVTMVNDRPHRLFTRQPASAQGLLAHVKLLSSLETCHFVAVDTRH